MSEQHYSLDGVRGTHKSDGITTSFDVSDGVLHVTRSDYETEDFHFKLTRVEPSWKEVD